MSLVSIIIPTYKRATYLDRAIQSCFDQTYKDIEVIVVDDNENDSNYSAEAKVIVEQFDGVRWIKNDGNLGGAKARNAGIMAAKGEYIAFLDDDDVYEPTKIEKQMRCIEEHSNQKCGMVYCYYNLKYDNGDIHTIRRDDEGCCLYEHLMENIAMTSAWLCPKDAILEVGGFDDVKCCQEGTLLLKLLKHGYEVYRVPEILMNMYVHDIKDGSGITNITENYIENAKLYEAKCLDAANHLVDKKRKAVYLVKYYWIYNLYYLLKNRKGKKEYLQKMIREDCFRSFTFKAICKYFMNNK